MIVGGLGYAVVSWSRHHRRNPVEAQPTIRAGDGGPGGDIYPGGIGVAGGGGPGGGIFIDTDALVRKTLESGGTASIDSKAVTVKDLLEQRLGVGRELLSRCEPMPGAFGATHGLPLTTVEEVANWSDAVKDLLRQLPDGDQKIKRFLAVPPQIEIAPASYMESELWRALSNRVNALAEIIEAV
jgi:hypothetical protein